MSLPAEKVNLVPPERVSSCWACGARARGHNPMSADREISFVAFDNNRDDETIPAGLLETVDYQEGQHIFRARDAFGRGSATYTAELPMLCSECIEQFGGLVGFGDLTELQAQLDEAQAELARISAERDQAVAEREDADQAVRALRAFERIGAAPKRSRDKTAA